MNRTDNNFQAIQHFVAFMLLASSFLPVLFINLPEIVGGHRPWTVIWLVLLLISSPRVFFKQQVINLIFYGIFIILIYLSVIYKELDYWNKNQILREFYEMLIGATVLYWYTINNKFNEYGKLTFIIFCFITITSMLSIYTSFINPMYVRDMVGVSIVGESEKEQIMSFARFGGGNYGFASAIVGLIPILVYFYKFNPRKLISKKFIIFLILIYLFALLKMQIFANILIVSIVLMLSIVGLENVKKYSFVMIAFGILLLLLPIDFYITLLIAISNLFGQDTELYGKFNDLAMFMQLGTYEGSGAGFRAERFPLLWDSFLSNPISGGEYSNGHLHWMNKLAVYGLMGSVPFAIIIYNHFKYVKRIVDKKFSFYLFLGLLGIVGLGILKNLNGREIWYMFFIILPGFYYMQFIKTKIF